MDFQADNFKLPSEAKVLVVAERTEGSNCVVYAFEKDENGHFGLKLAVDGMLGRNGLSNCRFEGDGTTPIGVWKLNTPFGQKDAQDGFPVNYIKVDESYVWSSKTNKLCQDLTQPGELVGTERYKDYYQYCLDFGYNPLGREKKGSALFLHCAPDSGALPTSGCVQIREDAMVKVMQLYGKYGDGACFMAIAPVGKMNMIYDTFGVYNGLCPDGDFS